MARTINKATDSQALVEKLLKQREEQAEYENFHALESTITMAFDTARNTMATVNNVAVICRNKSELKVVESHQELHQAYQALLA